MKKLNPVEYKILIELFLASNYRLQAYTLSQRVVLPFSQFLDNVSNLSKKNLLETDGALIMLTQSGFYAVLSKKNYSSVVKEIPNEFLKNKTLCINELYVPRRSLM